MEKRMEKEEEEDFEQFVIEDFPVSLLRSALERVPKENYPEAHKKLTFRLKLAEQEEPASV